MIVCKECQCQMERKWSCKCNSLDLVQMAKLKPLISKVNGWSNFFALVSREVRRELSPPSETKTELQIPEVVLEAVIEENLELAIKSHIIRVYVGHDGNKMSAARALGITSKTLYNKLTQYGIHEVCQRVKKKLIQ